MVNLNGQEYAWASLFARLDTFVRQQQQISVDMLVTNQRMRETLDTLPERIASAISARQASAAPTARACVGLDWNSLMRILGDGTHRLLAGLIPLGVVALADHLAGTQLLQSLSGLLK